MSKIPLTPFKIVIHLLLLFQSISSQNPDQEQLILLNLKKHFQSPPSISHWTPPSPPNSTVHCTWPEITCTNNSVTEISLPDKNITITIPSFICDLLSLVFLDLTWNYIPGTFPVLYNCSKLEYLDLSQNYFVGTIPNDVDKLLNLKYLNLGANNFSGDIPRSIGRLRKLKSLGLFQNQFNGTFPPEIGDLVDLEVLQMATNLKFLPQMVPEKFTQLKKLRVLWFSEANLIGEIPGSIGNMSNLEYLDLSKNRFIGNIPEGLFRLKNLTILFLHTNGLSGEIPKKIETFNMDVIDFSRNNLSGTIPDDFGLLTKLTGLGLYFNQLSGKIPESLGQLPNLINLGLFNNNLSGTLPQDIGRFSKLKSFQISSNNLTGTLPEYLCAGGELVGLIAFDNKLTGKLPESLGNCSSLHVIMIDNNSFSGQFVSGIWSLPSLMTLMISKNSFTGELPNVFGLNLSRIEMSNNMFSGEIPDGISTLKNLEVLIASNNRFNGTVHQGLTSLPYLTTLLLDRNQISGQLLLDIVSWKSLNILNFSRNQLSGQIPAQIGSLSVLTDLDLSENQFSGQIPFELGFLKLTSLNLSSNNLSGKIPSAFENIAYENSFLSNPGLCSSSGYLDHNVCNSEPKKSDSKKISTRFFAVIISIAAAAFVCALLFSIYLIRVSRKKKQGLGSKWKLTSFQRLNFTESNILSSLTENNLIGSGGSGKVYRVVLNREKDVVAVKKISSSKKLDHKLEKEFLAEVDILSTVRHSNIVKLLCCVSSENSKLLVYEYMENQSLDKWLHRKNNQPQTLSASVHHVSMLDWPKRMRIAIGAAQGLCYMHHDCSPAIVHRDVKSSNILLDDEFNAKIADFGLAKFSINPGDINTMSAVAGSFGYIAPEYAHTTRVNEKIDVYSFGVVLLELATGREAHGGGEHTSLAEWASRHFQEGKLVTDALDKEIEDPSYLDEMCNVFKLGIICTGILPSTRPSMRDVLQFLTVYNHAVEKREKNGGTEPLLKNSRRKDGDLASALY